MWSSIVNRIAGDDDNESIPTVFEASIINFDPLSDLEKQGVTQLVEDDKEEVNRQLFGRVDR